jgi:hypothetical protein
MEEPYFSFYLESKGTPFPTVVIEKSAHRDNETVRLRFRIQGQSVRGSAYYCLNDKPWLVREWTMAPTVALGNGMYEAAIPANAAAQGASWLALASDGRQVTVSSLIEAVPKL